MRLAKAPQRYNMADPKSGDWLQFLGALIAAGTGVALWFAERLRLSAIARRQERHRAAEFKAVVSLALADLANQIHPIITLGDISSSNFEDATAFDPASSGNKEQDISAEFLHELRYAASKMQILPVPILELSKAHARYLNLRQSSEVAAVFSGARKVARLLDSVAFSTDSMDEAVDALNVVVQASARLLERIDSLKTQLGPDHHDLIESPS